MNVEPQIRILPKNLSDFAIRVYGTESQNRELREQLIKLLAACEKARTGGGMNRQEDVAHYTAQILLSLDMLGGGSAFWSKVADHATEQIHQLAACMACHGFSEPGGECE